MHLQSKPDLHCVKLENYQVFLLNKPVCSGVNLCSRQRKKTCFLYFYQAKFCHRDTWQVFSMFLCTVSPSRRAICTFFLYFKFHANFNKAKVAPLIAQMSPDSILTNPQATSAQQHCRFNYLHRYNYCALMYCVEGRFLSLTEQH